MILSEFIISRSTVLKSFSPDKTSAIVHLYEWVMTKFWITEYSGCMKDFLSLTMKNIHSFHVFTIETYVCIYSNSQSVNSCYWNFQRLGGHCSKHIFKYFKSQCLLKILAHIIGLVSSWIHSRSVFNGIEKIALLVPKIR